MQIYLRFSWLLRSRLASAANTYMKLDIILKYEQKKNARQILIKVTALTMTRPNDLELSAPTITGHPTFFKNDGGATGQF